jgi:hypothetical protein
MTSVLLALTLGDKPLFWTPIALRWATERTHRARPLPPDDHRIRPDQAAVLIAAHNEELGVATTATATHWCPPRQHLRFPRR